MATTPGTYLRQRRQAAGLTVDDVAGRIGTTPPVSLAVSTGLLFLADAITDGPGLQVMIGQPGKHP
jgi:transcriptional regulator with XRE-family HTH domain